MTRNGWADYQPLDEKTRRRHQKRDEIGWITALTILGIIIVLWLGIV